MSLSEALPVSLTLRKKIQVLRWEKDERRLPERMVEQTTGGSLFHKEGLWIQIISIEPGAGEQRGRPDQRIEEDGGKLQRRGEAWDQKATSELLPSTYPLYMSFFDVFA